MHKYILLFLSLFCCSCGLPNYTYLLKPIVNRVSPLIEKEGEYFNVSGNNEANYLGHQLYYKLYHSKSLMQTQERQIAGTTYDSVSYIKSKGFNLIYKVDTSKSEPDIVHKNPLLLIKNQDDKNVEFSVQLDFSENTMGNTDSFQSSLICDYLGYKYYLCRYVKQNRIDKDNTEYKVKSFFQESFSKDDADIHKNYKAGESLYMLVYAVAFGRGDSCQNLYSDPSLVGRFELEVENFN